MNFRRFKPFTPPRKFTFVDPDSKRLFTGSSIQDLTFQIEGYRKQNELPAIEYLPIVIENFLCSLPVHAGMCTPRGAPKRGVMAYFRGGVAFLKNMLYKDFASQEVADSRAEICTRCPHNIFPDKGPFLKWIDDITNKSVGDRKSAYHEQLGLCELCTCPLRGKVLYNGKIELTLEQYTKMKSLSNPRCWQVEDEGKVEIHK